MLSAMWRLVRLEPRQAWISFEVWVTLVAARLALWILPWRALQSSLFEGATYERADPSADGPDSEEALYRIIRAHASVRSYVPRATCLVDALAVHALLRWRGYPTKLTFGAAKGAGGELLAHAWLTYEGTVLVGDIPDLHGYRTFSSAVREPGSDLTAEAESPAGGPDRA